MNWLRHWIGRGLFLAGFYMMPHTSRVGISIMVRPGWKWADENPEEFRTLLQRRLDAEKSSHKQGERRE